MNKLVYAIATMDTKGHEIDYLAKRMRARGVTVATVDVGTQSPATVPAEIDRRLVAGCFPGEGGAEAVLQLTDRGQAVTAMGQALECFLRGEHAQGRVAGVIGIGGGGGTALISPALRALPIGVPKLMVSTMASGNTEPYVGCTDIMMMYSVVDIAGLNTVSRRVLANAAHAMAGMVGGELPPDENKPALGMTMFGVTTPCVELVRSSLEAQGFDCLVFHATGTGGQAMEKLVEAGFLRGVLDITTTEVADEVVGGVLPAGPLRFDVTLARQIPLVLSLGALDMVNFGARATIPEKFKNRRLHVHNAQVTLMRTTPDENRQCARWLASKLNRSTAPVVLLIPEKGVSLLDAPGQPFHDPEADAALFEELERTIAQTPERRLVRLPLHINDPEFAAALVRTYLDLEAARPTVASTK